jgi:hypothetical protein
VTPCVFIDENVLYLPGFSTFYAENEAGYLFETSINAYQNIRRHIPKCPDFDTAGRRRSLEDLLQANFKKYGVRFREGIEVAQVREKL